MKVRVVKFSSPQMERVGLPYKGSGVRVQGAAMRSLLYCTPVLSVLHEATVFVLYLF